MPWIVPYLLIAVWLAPAPATNADAQAAPAASVHDHSSDPVSLTLDPASGPVRIPFILIANHIYLRGRVNDSDSLWVVLDSGASANAIDAGVAKAIGLEVTSTGHGRGAGGQVDVGHVPSVTVKLPGVTFAGAIGTMPLDAFRKQTGRAMDVIVGAPLIQRCVLRIDYAARMLEFLPAGNFQYQGKGAIVPLTFQYDHPYITARITLPGRDPIEGKFVVDLGSSQAVILTPRFIEKENVVAGIGPTIEARGRGVGGQIGMRVGRIPSVELGGITFERPITVLPVSSQTLVGDADAIGNIGGDLMRRFTVTLDYARQRMILEPNAQIREPFEADMSGLGLRMGPEGSNALEVEWLQADSPATQAGIQPNDLIEKVDGKSAVELGTAGLREMFRHEGDRHVLTIRRGDSTREITLTTRRMI